MQNFNLTIDLGCNRMVEWIIYIGPSSIFTIHIVDKFGKGSTCLNFENANIICLI
jgi:hypothetical protein